MTVFAVPAPFRTFRPSDTVTVYVPASDLLKDCALSVAVFLLVLLELEDVDELLLVLAVIIVLDDPA